MVRKWEKEVTDDEINPFDKPRQFPYFTHTQKKLVSAIDKKNSEVILPCTCQHKGSTKPLQTCKNRNIWNRIVLRMLADQSTDHQFVRIFLWQEPCSRWTVHLFYLTLICYSSFFNEIVTKTWASWFLKQCFKVTLILWHQQVRRWWKWNMW